MSQKARLEAAFRWAQRKTQTSYHFYLRAVSPGDLLPNALIQIEQTQRGDEDQDAFLVSYVPAQIRQLSAERIRRRVRHEVLHALTWRVAKRAKQKDWESLVYHLERVIFGPDNPNLD